jgi:hypothetical protein
VALDRGGHDNITVIVATWSGPDWVEEDASTPVMPSERELSYPERLLVEDDTLSDRPGGGERVTEELSPSDLVQLLEPRPEESTEQVLPLDLDDPSGDGTPATEQDRQVAPSSPAPGAANPMNLGSSLQPAAEPAWGPALIALALAASLALAGVLWLALR